MKRHITVALLLLFGVFDFMVWIIGGAPEQVGLLHQGAALALRLWVITLALHGLRDEAALQQAMGWVIGYSVVMFFLMIYSGRVGKMPRPEDPIMNPLWFWNTLEYAAAKQLSGPMVPCSLIYMGVFGNLITVKRRDI
ncbi:hypothetical protein [Nitratidesulfovibrio liaohensis]|uniref:hypothetical protein n=1 Tax=Nitratidesulfovibrio liaohensis TaxID=2604158 RepID=UPI001420BC9C|nr:hypothetical protein [Nitratidesulfovibrio liaohensis]NHZ46396.1 hypothetical protein [Nitratidesulfovibrio liaohensis]